MKLVRVKGKGQRWKKGQSCVSNAPNKKYRDAVRSRFFQKLEGESGLTADAIAEHNQTMLQISSQLSELNVEQEDVQSRGRTFNTTATCFSTCTLPAFNKFFLKFDKDSAKHKHMLAVHAMVQEYMTENNYPETNECYCSALIISAIGVMENEECLDATIALLSKVIKRVPKEKLRKTYEEYDKLFNEILDKYHDSNMHSLLDNVIGCASTVLRGLEIADWNNKRTLQLLDKLLELCIDQRHTVRKSAQYNISAILRASSFMLSEDDDMEDKADSENQPKPAILHPGSDHVVNFIVSCLCSPSDMGKKKQTLYVLVLLRQVIMAFSKKQIKKVIVWILSIMQLRDSLINHCALEALYNLFASNPTVETLNAKTNIALINALISEKGAATASGVNLVIVPGMNDKSTSIVWISCVNVALNNLYILDAEKALEILPSWFKLLVPYWKSEHEDIHVKVNESFELLLEECIGKSGDKVTTDPMKQHVCEIIACLEGGLSLQYQSAWDLVFKTLGTCFSTLGPHLPSELHGCLKNLCQLVHNSEISNKCGLEHAIGCAITGLGPKVVAVDIVPVQVTGNIVEDEKYFWILPLLIKYVKNTRLLWYIQYFLPLAAKCSEIIRQLKKQEKENTLLFKAYKTVEIQIWTMLTSFANNAIDLDEALEQSPGFLKNMGDLLKERHDLTNDILATLRNLVNTCVSKKNKMQKAANNYLSILFNIYRSPESKEAGGINRGHRLASYETIILFLKIAPQSVRKDLTNRLCKMIKDVNSQSPETLIDLAKALVPYADYEDFLRLQEISISIIKEKKEKEIQKATYKLIKELLSTIQNQEPTEASKNLENFADTLVHALGNAKVGSKAPRMKCLGMVLRHITSDMNKEVWRVFIKRAVGEVIVCYGRNQSESVKKAVFQFLSEMGATMQIIEECSAEESITHCLRTIMAGLAGQPSLISNTVYAITALSFQYRELITEKNADLIITSILTLMASHAQDVVTACLGFVRSSVQIFPIVLLDDYLDRLVSALCNLHAPLQRKFRNKTRDIFSSFIRKFGADRITALIPKDDIVLQKRIKSLRKIEAQKKRSKNKKDDEQDESSDSDDEVITSVPSMDQILKEIDDSDDEQEENNHDNKKKNGKLSKKMDKEKLKTKVKKGAWIKEDEDEIVDLLDATTSQKIKSRAPSDPKTKKVNKNNNDDDDEMTGDFPVDKASGKLVIKEPKKDKMKTNSDIKPDDYDSYMHIRNGALQGKIKKRKRTESEDSGDDEVLRELQGKKKISSKNQSLKEIKKKKFDYGAEFRSKKAGGDVKVKGKSDPYAYVPFSKDRLNRRKQSKYAGQLKSLVKGAKRGANKGTKMKSKNKKR